MRPMPHSVLALLCGVFHHSCCLRGRMCVPCSIDLDIDARRSCLAICALHILCSTRLPALLRTQFKRVLGTRGAMAKSNQLHC